MAKDPLPPRMIIVKERSSLTYKGVEVECDYEFLRDSETLEEYTTTALDGRNLKRMAIAWKEKTGGTTDYLEKILNE